MITYNAIKDFREGWRVEGWDDREKKRGPTSIAIFISPTLEQSQKAAEEYADWQNTKDGSVSLTTDSSQPLLKNGLHRHQNFLKGPSRTSE